MTFATGGAPHASSQQQASPPPPPSWPKGGGGHPGCWSTKLPLLGQPEGHGVLGAWLPQWWQLGGVETWPWGCCQLRSASSAGQGTGGRTRLGAVPAFRAGGLTWMGPLPLSRAWALEGERWAWWPCPVLSEQRITFVWWRFMGTLWPATRTQDLTPRSLQQLTTPLPHLSDERLELKAFREFGVFWAWTTHPLAGPRTKPFSAPNSDLWVLFDPAVHWAHRRYSFFVCWDLNGVFYVLSFRWLIISCPPWCHWFKARMVSVTSSTSTSRYTFCFPSDSTWSRSWHLSVFPVEWRLFSLRLLSETTSLLVNQEPDDGKEVVNVDSDNNLLALIRDVLLPQ